LMNPQMIRVISSPSSSTTGFFTLIFAILFPPYLAREEVSRVRRSPASKRPDIRIRPGREQAAERLWRPRVAFLLTRMLRSKLGGGL
jgi:hypothetical protein